MTVIEILEKLNSLVDSGVSKSKLERDLGIPSNTLSSILSGKRLITDKSCKRISNALNKPPYSYKEGGLYRFEKGVFVETSMLEVIFPIVQEMQLAQLKLQQMERKYGIYQAVNEPVDMDMIRQKERAIMEGAGFNEEQIKQVQDNLDGKYIVDESKSVQIGVSQEGITPVKPLLDKPKGKVKVVDLNKKVADGNYTVDTERNNALINAARGRDGSGINKDELDELGQWQEPEWVEPIEAQIKAVEAEKIPKDRDTLLGRKVWAKEQAKRIEELKNKLKCL